MWDPEEYVFQECSDEETSQVFLWCSGLRELEGMQQWLGRERTVEGPLSSYRTLTQLVVRGSTNDASTVEMLLGKVGDDRGDVTTRAEIILGLLEMEDPPVDSLVSVSGGLRRALRNLFSSGGGIEAVSLASAALVALDGHDGLRSGRSPSVEESDSSLEQHVVELTHALEREQQHRESVQCRELELRQYTRRTVVFARIGLLLLSCFWLFALAGADFWIRTKLEYDDSTVTALVVTLGVAGLGTLWREAYRSGLLNVQQ
jgi:hypothetical protein